MSMNIFADLGFENPELELAKARVVHVIYQLMRKKRLDECATANLLSMMPLELNEILNGHWEDYSLDSLIEFVHTLDASIRFDPSTGEIVDEATAPLALIA